MSIGLEDLKPFLPGLEDILDDMDVSGTGQITSSLARCAVPRRPISSRHSTRGMVGH